MVVLTDDARSALVAPERTAQQRLDALEHANAIRTFRKDRKRELKRREASVTALLLEVPPELETMKLIDLLLAVPKLGRVKVNRIMARERVSPSKTLGGLSERQRVALVAVLAPYAGR